jgi:hypothetical protein
MKPFFSHLFYSKLPFNKRISHLSIFFALFLLGIGCGGAGVAPGGINLPAPTADIEAGPAAFTAVCDTISGAPSGAMVQITNTSNPNDPMVRANLDATGSFSVNVCVQPNETLNIQIFDSAGTAISPIQTILRTGSEGGGICAAPSNPAPTCP